MRAACSNKDLTIFFGTSQAVAIRAIVSDKKWTKQPISMGTRLTFNPES